MGNATNQYAWTCPDYSATTSGDYTVTIAYKNYATQTFTITVNQPTENGFEVDTSELDLSVDYGTDLDLTGLIVEATYAESAMNNTALSLKTVDEDGYEIDNGGYDKNQPNTYTITVSYKEYEDQTFEIIVEQAKRNWFCNRHYISCKKCRLRHRIRFSRLGCKGNISRWYFCHS